MIKGSGIVIELQAPMLGTSVCLSGDIVAALFCESYVFAILRLRLWLYFLIRLRAMPSPAKPSPRTASVAGSGVWVFISTFVDNVP